MRLIKVAIEETIVQEFEVEANTFEEALLFAKEKYKVGEFVLSDAFVTDKKIAILSTSDEEAEWVNF